MDVKIFRAWKHYVPDLAAALKRLQEKTIIAVGMSVFPRSIPSLFLKKYIIFCARDTADTTLLREYARIHYLEQYDPIRAIKAMSISFLLGNYQFQKFVNSRKPFRLLFYSTNPEILKIVIRQRFEWIGNWPDSFKDVLLKGKFRDTARRLGLPTIPEWRVGRPDLAALTFQEIWNRWKRPVALQRADVDVAGKLGTFFIRTADDLQKYSHVLLQEKQWTTLVISPFIDKYSVSMLGCITPLGVLTSTLQLQLVDVPEVLHGQEAAGVFLGHDWGACVWPEAIEQQAQTAVESIGAHLAEQGYKGIFGVDFLYDSHTQTIFPIECNPRFTGALPVYSLMTLAHGVPPIEFFHLLAHLAPQVDFKFVKVNQAFKKRRPFAHISLTPKNITVMNLPLVVGIYSYNKHAQQLRYKRPGILLSDFQSENECLIIDSVPHLGQRITESGPRLFKIIFPRSIAQSSSEIEAEIGEFLINFSFTLRKAILHHQTSVATLRLESPHPLL